MIISVDNFFNVLNLIAHIGIVIFLLKRFVIGNLAKLIVLEKQDLVYFKKQEQEYLQKCKMIEEQIAQNQKTFETLQQKFKIWNQQADQFTLQEKAVCLQRQKNIEMSTLKKIKYLQHRKFIDIEVPHILQNVHKALQQKFEQDQSFGKKYQTKVLQALEKLS
ncbi:hypothetical protein KBB68_02360 [Candidatus Babeliales bacterium]|nr:hypothetical protein [Candidatus Babeliales bacterium]